MRFFLANAKNNLAIYGAYGLFVAGQTGAVCFVTFVSGFCFTKGALLAAGLKLK